MKQKLSIHGSFYYAYALATPWNRAQIAAAAKQVS